MTSSGYSRGGYSENEGCTITMDPPAPLSVLDFEVEDYFDHLSIRGTDGPDKCEGGVSCWTGSNGPDGVTPAGAIVWTSDFFAPAKGFKICTTVPGGGPSSPAGPAADDEPCDSYFYNYGYLFGNVECGANKPPPPPAAPPPPPGFIVESGPCTTTKDGSCVRSDNYPKEYASGVTCVIAPTQELLLSPTVGADAAAEKLSFATEKVSTPATRHEERPPARDSYSHEFPADTPASIPPQNYDFLTIGDEKYTGTRQPAYTPCIECADGCDGCQSLRCATGTVKTRTLDADGEPAYYEVIPHKYIKVKPHQKIVWVSDLCVWEHGVRALRHPREIPNPRPFLLTLPFLRILTRWELCAVEDFGQRCDDTCGWPLDGTCDDGGPGSEYVGGGGDECPYGTDCFDCGERIQSPPPPPAPPAAPPAPRCLALVDLVLVLDRSGSVGPQQDEIKGFADQVLSQFELDEASTLFGLVTFNDNASIPQEMLQGYPRSPTTATR